MKPDNIPECVRAVLDRPGLYTFEGAGMRWAFEVDGAGRVYQLKPRTLKRAGPRPLSPDGWNAVAQLGTVAPLDRAEWLAQFE